MYRILVTSKSFAKYNGEIVDKLKENGILIERPEKSNLTSKEIAEIIEPYDGIVCGIDKIDKQVMEAGTKLKIVHMHGTGTDHIDIAEASRRGIAVGNCPGANATAVAELNLAILLAEARKVIKYSNMIYEKKWERRAGLELSNKTIGIIGLGHIGRKFVELLKGFNMKVVAYDPYPNLEWVKENNVTLTEDINDVFRQGDFISLHLPLLEATHNMIDENAIALMKEDVIIVNTSRGGLVETGALAKAVKAEKIRGAALDAFTSEPIEQDSELLDLDITLTPHLGASTVETAKNVSSMVVENLIDVLVCQKYDNIINKDKICLKTA